MKISNNINKSHSNVSFSSLKLFDVALQKKTASGVFEVLPAAFTKLSSSSNEDFEAVYDVFQKWGKGDYVEAFCESFYKNKNKNVGFYFIELFDRSKNLYDRTLCLIKTKIIDGLDGKHLDLSLLQAKPELINQSSRDIKGLGEAGLVAVEKLAKNSNAKSIEVVSTNNPFYLKRGYNLIEDFGDEGGFLEKVIA